MSISILTGHPSRIELLVGRVQREGHWPGTEDCALVHGFYHS